MTAEKFTQKYYVNGCGEWMFEEALKEFAKVKCKELLEIVYLNAEIDYGYDEGGQSINKDSILNAVDLNKFIV